MVILCCPTGRQTRMESAKRSAVQGKHAAAQAGVGVSVNEMTKSNVQKVGAHAHVEVKQSVNVQATADVQVSGEVQVGDYGLKKTCQKA